MPDDIQHDWSAHFDFEKPAFSENKLIFKKAYAKFPKRDPDRVREMAVHALTVQWKNVNVKKAWIEEAYDELAEEFGLNIIWDFAPINPTLALGDPTPKTAGQLKGILWKVKMECRVFRRKAEFVGYEFDEAPYIEQEQKIISQMVAERLAPDKGLPIFTIGPEHVGKELTFDDITKMWNETGNLIYEQAPPNDLTVSLAMALQAPQKKSNP